jgi:hypothetical protein
MAIKPQVFGFDFRYLAALISLDPIILSESGHAAKSQDKTVQVMHVPDKSIVCTTVQQELNSSETRCN